MSDFATLPKDVKARKEHTCFLCTKPILPGESHVFWKNCSDGRFYETRCHPDCLKFLEAYCKSTPGCLAQCDGMSEECMWEAMYDMICIPCGKHHRGTGDKFNPLKCEYALKKMKEMADEEGNGR